MPRDAESHANQCRDEILSFEECVVSTAVIDPLERVAHQKATVPGGIAGITIALMCVSDRANGRCRCRDSTAWVMGNVIRWNLRIKGLFADLANTSVE